jgi:hypothetical protein
LPRQKRRKHVGRPDRLAILEAADMQVEDEIPQLKIATSRYQAADRIARSGLVPVGTTVGNPRFKLGYVLAGRCGLIAPYGLFGKGLSESEFRDGYVARLEKSGVAAIRERLIEIAGEDAPGVVLLCFEDVHAGEFCHRTVFAEWWEARTGEHVPEL